MPVFTQELELPSSVADLGESFSNKFCVEISSGTNPDKAGEIAAKEIVRGLIFSPNIKEIMSVPKDDLALLVSNNIYSKCGQKLEISQDQLTQFLVKFADKDRRPSEPTPFKPFGIG